jgi:tetratricopeptide (TPR) repeat protein
LEAVTSINSLFRQARHRLPSPHRQDAHLSVPELATEVNAWLHRHQILDADVDDDYVRKLDSGRHRWPLNPQRRRAFRAVLRVETDAEIGFYPHRRSSADMPTLVDANQHESPVTITEEPSDLRAAGATPRDVADPNGGPRRIAGPTVDLTDAEFISVPVQTANGVIAYVVTRREFLPRLAARVPTLALPDYMAAAVAPETAPHADVAELLAPSPGAVDGRSAEQSSFATVTRLLASQRQAVAPAALLSLVEAHRDSLAMLFRRAASDPVRADIGALLGEASIVASRLWSAMGNRDMAIANCAFARHLADRLNDSRLGATARIFESNLHSEAATLIGAEGDVLLGLRMLEEAAAVDRILPAAARARIAAEQAQAYAVLKLRRECRQALDRARVAVDEIDETDRTGLFSDWSPSRLLVYEGTCSLFLGDGKKAVGALSQAVQHAEADEGNTNVLLAARVDLASAYAEHGELKEGCKLLGETFVRLAEMGNRRGIERAWRARERLAHWEQERAVRELDEWLNNHDLHRWSEPDGR